MIYLIVVIFALMFVMTQSLNRCNKDLNVKAVIDGVKIYVNVDENIFTSFSVNFAGEVVNAEYKSEGYWYAFFGGTNSGGVLILPDAPSGCKWKNLNDGTLYSANNINVYVSSYDSYDGYGSIKIKLVQDTTIPTLTVTGSVECDNSMMLLTIIESGSTTPVQEIGFVIGQTNVTASGIILKLNTTYKILVTKPFGSVLEVEGATKESSTVYSFATGENATLSISFKLTGNGRWSNTVVV